MSTIRIKGDTSQSVDLAAGASDGNLNITSSASGAEVFVDTGKGLRVKGTSVSGLIVDADPNDASVSSRLVLRNGTDAGAAYYISTSGWVFNTGSVVGSTSGTPRVYFDNTGYVRMPYQPGFHAYNNSTNPSPSTFSGDNTVLHFEATQWNDGGYNTTTSRYTIPVAGKYVVYGQTRFDGSTDYSRVHVAINGNGGWWYPGIHHIYDSTSTSYRTGSVTGVLNLAAGDYIELRGGTSNSSGTHQGEGSFGAYFLG